MNDQRLTAWKAAGEWVCATGQEEGDVGRRRICSAFPDIGERRATWLSKVARDNGYDWQTIDDLLNNPQTGSRLEPVNGPEADEPIESLIDRRCNAFKRLDAATQDEIEIRVKDDKPIGILMMGDPHCFTEKHEILTRRGWLHQADLTNEDLVAGVDENGVFTYQPIQRIIRREVDEDIVVCKSKTAPFEATTGHRFLLEKATSKGSRYGEQKFYRADELTDSQFRIPLAAWGETATSAPFSDDEIRLLGWILTDAYWHVVGGVFKGITIYQGKPDRVAEIEDLMLRLGETPTRRYREPQPPREWRGKIMRDHYGQHSWRFNGEAARRIAAKFGLEPSKQKNMPAVVDTFDSTQFKVLLDTIIAADGDYAAKNTARIAKQPRFLEALQILALKHGHKTKMMQKGLSITVSQTFGTIHPKRNITHKRYVGTVWCVTVPHGNFFTRCEGVAYLSGNCDDDGTNLPLIAEHRRLVVETEGLYGGCIGDVLNNWVGKLARLYGAQSTSEAEAWRLTEWFFSEVPWLFFVMGNHDRWGQGGNVLRQIAKGNVIAATHEQEIKLRLTNPTWGRDFRIWARHDFKGTSQYQAVQGMLRAAKMRDYRADLYVAGHTHDAGFYSEPREDGTYFTALRLGSYKVHDDYAAEKGFPKKKGGEAALVIIDKDRHLVTFDIEAGVDYLSWLRQRR